MERLKLAVMHAMQELHLVSPVNPLFSFYKGRVVGLQIAMSLAKQFSRGRTFVVRGRICSVMDEVSEATKIRIRHILKTIQHKVGNDSPMKLMVDGNRKGLEEAIALI